MEDDICLTSASSLFSVFNWSLREQSQIRNVMLGIFHGNMKGGGGEYAPKVTHPVNFVFLWCCNKMYRNLCFLCCMWEKSVWATLQREAALINVCYFTSGSYIRQILRDTSSNTNSAPQSSQRVLLAPGWVLLKLLQRQKIKTNKPALFLVSCENSMRK